MQSMTGPDFNAELAERARQAIARHRKWYLFEGIAMMVLGIAAIILPQVATLATTVLVGWLFVIGGAFRIWASLSRRETPGFWMSAATGVLALVLGVVLLVQPFAGMLTLTMVLVALFLIEGTISIMLSLQFRRMLGANWGFMLANGIVDLVLAVLILAGWPGTATWAVGLMVGINLVFFGLTLAMTAAYAGRMES